MQHSTVAWKTRAVAFLAAGLACLPMVAHAETESITRSERTSAFDVTLTIGPAQSAPSTSMPSSDAPDMAMGHDMSMGDQPMNNMQPQQADQGMAVNHWLDVHITQAGSNSVVNDVAPTIRIVDKSSGEARDLPSVMGMQGGMNVADFHYGQNVFLPDGTYQVNVQVGPADTAQFRDVVVASSPMMAEPGMDAGMGADHAMSPTDQTAPRQP